MYAVREHAKGDGFSSIEPNEYGDRQLTVDYYGVWCYLLSAALQ